MRRRAEDVKRGAPLVSRETLVLLAAAAVLCAAVLGFAARHLDTPGLYYDEVIQAAPAAAVQVE